MPSTSPIFPKKGPKDAALWYHPFMDLFCRFCKQTYQGTRRDRLYCSVACSCKASYRRRLRKPSILDVGRKCAWCKNRFRPEWPDCNRRYCSTECARKAITASRRAFHRRNPRRQREYNSRRPFKDAKLIRLRRKYPQLPTACQACGENRVVEVAHRPAFRHLGGVIGSNIKHRMPHMIWILCPTCHKLLDKGICTAEELHLS